MRCPSCGKRFKNAASLSSHKYRYHSNAASNARKPKLDTEFEDEASLASHRYRYHPYAASTARSPKSDTEFEDELLGDVRLSSITGDVSSLRVDTDVNKYRIKTLKSTVDELERMISVLNRTVSKQGVELNTIATSLNQTASSPSSDGQFDEIYTLRYQNEANSKRIKDIESTLENVNELPVVQVNELKVDDLIDDLVEIRTMVASNNYSKLEDDIPKLRNSLELMLRAMNLDGVEEEDVKLLQQLVHSSKSIAKDILKSNFSRISNIFKELEPEFEKMFVEEIIDENESSDESEAEDDEELEVNKPWDRGDQQISVASDTSDDDSNYTDLRKDDNGSSDESEAEDDDELAVNKSWDKDAQTNVVGDTLDDESNYTDLHEDTEDNVSDYQSVMSDTD